MPLDPSIALSSKPVQLQNPLDEYLKLQQGQNFQSQNALNKLKVDQETQESTDRNALRGYLSGVTDLNDPTVVSNIITKYGDTGSKLIKSIQDQKKAQVDLDKIEGR